MNKITNQGQLILTVRKSLQPKSVYKNVQEQYMWVWRKRELADYKANASPGRTDRARTDSDQPSKRVVYEPRGEKCVMRTYVQRPVEAGLDDVDDEVLAVGEDERPTGSQTRSSEYVGDSEDGESDKCHRHYCVIWAACRK